MGVLLASSALLMTPPAQATAADKQICLAASDKGQSLKLQGKLRAAREQFLVCSRTECPAIVRQDCAQWVNDVVSALPSVVVGARDARGHDLFDVKVSMDGAVLTVKLDGKPVFVDPGAHTVRYERADGASPAVEEQVLVREGERNRSLTVNFSGPAPTTAAVPSGAAPPAVTPPPTEQHRGSVSPLAYVMGGVGVIALGAALYFDLSANSDVDGLRAPPPAGCAPHCDAAQVDPIATKYTLAGVMVGVGGVAVGAAVLLFLLRPGKKAERATTSIRFDLTSAPGGGEARLFGRF